MILKRMTVSLRRQDWTAVAIEFALVVFGVLLAFQINEWGVEREARAARDAATIRLLDESEETIAFFRLGVLAQRQLNSALGEALEEVQSGQWRRSDRDRLAEGLRTATVMTTPNPPSSVYDDLVASGTFGNIDDLGLRSAVAKYRAALEFHRESIEYIRRLMPDLSQSEAFEFAFVPGNASQPRLTIDFTKLEQDKRLLEQLSLVAQMQMISLVLRERNLKRAIEMCTEIGRVAKRPCNRNRPMPKFD